MIFDSLPNLVKYKLEIPQILKVCKFLQENNLKKT